MLLSDLPYRDHGLPPSLNYTGHVVINVSNINEAPISVTLDNNDVSTLRLDELP